MELLQLIVYLALDSKNTRLLRENSGSESQSEVTIDNQSICEVSIDNENSRLGGLCPEKSQVMALCPEKVQVLGHSVKSRTKSW